MLLGGALVAFAVGAEAYHVESAFRVALLGGLMALLQGLALLAAPSSGNPVYSLAIRRQSRLMLWSVFLVPACVLLGQKLPGGLGIAVSVVAAVTFCALLLRSYAKAQAKWIRDAQRQLRRAEAEGNRSPQERALLMDAVRELDEGSFAQAEVQRVDQENETRRSL